MQNVSIVPICILSFLVSAGIGWEFVGPILMDSDLFVSLALVCVFFVCSTVSAFELRSPFAPGTAIIISCSALGLFAGSAATGSTGFSAYMVLLCYFHFSEFAILSLSHGPSFDSLMLNHGYMYASAFAASTAEYFVSPHHFLPGTQYIGFVFSILGLALRATSLLSAGSAFTHLISTERTRSHKLVTSGLYGYVRHPGYAGWLIWVTSSQILAGNPISCVCFLIVTWIFFKDRIAYEESLLRDMFGHEYSKYQARVKWSGIPFI